LSYSQQLTQYKREVNFGADDLLTQAADFDSPRPKRLKSLGRTVLPSDEMGHWKSAAWVPRLYHGTPLSMNVNSQTGGAMAGEPSLMKFLAFVRNFVMHDIQQTRRVPYRKI